MAETYRINIEFRPEYNRPLIIPERIRVPRNSIIEWTIKEFDDLYFRQRYYRKGLIFTVYFDKESPFGWKKESLRLYGDPLFPPFFLDKPIKLAEGTAENTGDFKYGVKVSAIDNDEPIYDEDPYIEVY